jgi:hypothetical protein
LNTYSIDWQTVRKLTVPLRHTLSTTFAIDWEPEPAMEAFDWEPATAIEVARSTLPEIPISRANWLVDCTECARSAINSFVDFFGVDGTDILN